MHLQKTILKKKSYFEEELANKSSKQKKLWKILKSLSLSSDKASKSKICVKKDGTIQIESMENANIFQRFFSELAKDLSDKL